MKKFLKTIFFSYESFILWILIICFVFFAFLGVYDYRVKTEGSHCLIFADISQYDDGTYLIDVDDSGNEPNYYVYVKGERKKVDQVLYENMDKVDVMCTCDWYMYKGKKVDYTEEFILTLDPDYAKAHDLLPIK